MTDDQFSDDSWLLGGESVTDLSEAELDEMVERQFERLRNDPNFQEHRVNPEDIPVPPMPPGFLQEIPEMPDEFRREVWTYFVRGQEVPPEFWRRYRRAMGRTEGLH